MPKARNFHPPYMSAQLPVKQRVEDLMKRMTVDEKIAQLQAITYRDRPTSEGKFDPVKAKERFPHGIGHWGWPQNLVQNPGQFNPLPMQEMVAGAPSPISGRGTAAVIRSIQTWFRNKTRLGIPVLFHVEALHGMGVMGATSFPQAIAMAATWDPELVGKGFSDAAAEGRSVGISHVLSPVLDLARDPRWGRIEETYGEDPFLAARMAVAAVNGLQGSELGPASVAATLKHFAAYSKPVGGRNLAGAECGERELRECFLSVFEAAITEAKAATVMPGYNEIDGIPCHANRWLLRDVLRKEWGFDGIVVADYAAIPHLNGLRQVAPTDCDAMLLAFNAGVDVELPDANCSNHLPELVRSGRIDAHRLDDAIRRVLELKFRLGLFDEPYPDENAAEAIINCPDHQETALRMAEKAIVLLQNDSHTLPFDSKNLARLAVIGPNATVGHIGGYGGWPKYVVDPLSGFQALLGKKTVVVHSEGARCCELDEKGRAVPVDPAKERDRIREAVELASTCDAIVLCLGENEKLCGEGLDSHDLELPGLQLELASAIAALGKPTAAVLVNGRPLVLSELIKLVPAVIEAFYLGQEGGHAIAAAIFGKINPGGKLPVSFPRHVGCLPCNYNFKPGSMGQYVFGDPTPLFPFGYGLSYTSFEYLEIDARTRRISAGNNFTVEITIANTGPCGGDEVVQLYLQDNCCSVTRPHLQLCAFQRVHLRTGEIRTICITVGADRFACWNVAMQRVVEPGSFTLKAGGNSGDLPLSLELEVVD